MPAHRPLLALLAAALVGGTAAPAGAQPRAPRAGAPTARVIPLRDAVQMLHASSADEVREGVAALTRLGTPEVVPPLVELVESGVDDALLDYVVEKLGIIGRPEAIDELSTLLHHRRSAVREKAVKNALSHIRDNRVRAAAGERPARLRARCVRGGAAGPRGDQRPRQSVALLQRAFERNVPEASESIGRLGDWAACHRMLESVGRSPLSVLLPGFGASSTAATSPTREAAHRRAAGVALAHRGGEGFLQSWVTRSPPPTAPGRAPARCWPSADPRRAPARARPRAPGRCAVNRSQARRSPRCLLLAASCMPPIRTTTAFSSRFGDNDRAKITTGDRAPAAAADRALQRRAARSSPR
jgi:hypothetical protein